MGIFSFVFNALFFLAISPFLSGVIAKIKNNLRMRKGQSILQPYYNLAKLFSKDEVISGTASWIFRVAPVIVLASSLCAAMLVPVWHKDAPLAKGADILALIFVFSLGRFFLALSAIDTGSSFGGMGGSREMFISSLVEPCLCLALFAVSLIQGTSRIPMLESAALNAGSIAACLALFLIILAETSRIPVDNQETHLELTMIHEAMVLEYSGPRLACIELASHVKQLVWFCILSRIIFPSGPLVYAGIVIIAATVAVVEISVAKMRLFRAADFLGFAFVMAFIAAVCAALGV